MAPEDRQALIVSHCLTMSHLMRRAAREYAEMDPDTLGQRLQDDKVVMTSITMITREELKGRLGDLRQVLEKGDARYAEVTGPRTDLLLIAGLPDLWHEETE
jgi:hypothetical protein